MNARGSAGQYKQFRRKAKLVREDAEVVHAQYMCALLWSLLMSLGCRSDKPNQSKANLLAAKS